MWAQVWNIILLVILLTALQVPTGEEEIKKKTNLQTMPIKITIKM